MTKKGECKKQQQRYSVSQCTPEEKRKAKMSTTTNHPYVSSPWLRSIASRRAYAACSCFKASWHSLDFSRGQHILKTSSHTTRRGCGEGSFLF
jgi:hypothetical protein